MHHLDRHLHMLNRNSGMVKFHGALQTVKQMLNCRNKSLLDECDMLLSLLLTFVGW